MKYINKISLILVLCIVTMAVSFPVYAQETWKSWSAAAAMKNEDGTASIKDTVGAGTNLSKYQSFSNDFDVEFSMRIDSFSKEQGVQVITGKYRLYMNFAGNQITYFTGEGSSNIKAVLGYNIGNQMHDYRFSISGNKANIFIDDNFVGNIVTQTKADGSPRIQFWTKSLAGEVAALTTTEPVYTATIVAAEVPYDERKEIKLDVNDFSEFDVIDDGGVTLAKEGYAHMEAVTPGVSYKLRKYTGIDRDFDYKFDYRLVSSYGESGAQIIWNGHRILIYFYPDYCRVLTKNGQYRYSYGRSVLGEWHNYRVEVRDDWATLYMDDKLMSSYEMVSWESDRPYIGFWLNRKDEYYQTIMDVDNIHLIPYTYEAKLESPKDGSEYVSGSEIVCKIEDIGADEVVYYANGTEIGRATRENGYKFVWKAPAGSYQITAVGADGIKADISNIKVIPPVKTALELPEASLIGEKVVARLSGGSVFDNIIRTELYIDGHLFSGKEGCQNVIEIDGLGVGNHNVFAKYILKNGLESVSENKQISVEAFSVDVVLPDSYEAEFLASGTGEAVCYFANGGFGHHFKIDEQGSYRLVVDGGVYYAYRNGKLYASDKMAATQENNIVLDEKGINITDFKVSGTKDVFSYFDAVPEAGKKYTLYNIPQEYSVEFGIEGDSGELSFYDGVYGLLLNYSENKLSCMTTVGGKGDERESVIYDSVSFGAHYRVQVSRGIAQLFENNVFIASFRIPEYYQFTPSVMAKNASYVRIKSAENSFTFFESFDEELDSWNMKNNGWKQIKNGDNGLLKSSASDARPLLAYGFSKNPELTASVQIDGQPSSGGIYITARNNTDYAYMYAGYDYAEGSYVVREKYMNEVKTVYKVKGDFPSEAQLKAILADNRLELYVNEELNISTDAVSYIGFGRFGIIADGITASLDSFEYVGEGNVTPGIYDVTLPDIMNMELVDTEENGLMYLGAYGKNQHSYDNGFTWSQEAALPYSSTTKAGNIIRLKSGKYLMMTRTQVGADKYLSQAYISENGISDWEGAYTVEKSAVARVSMNGKLDQMQDGRIFFASGELAEGIEEHSIFRIYYSDDDGKTWKMSQTEFNSYNNFCNMQEIKIIGTDEKNHLRLYGRTEYGYIYYCDSYDNGVTWKEEFTPSQLVAPMNAFNIRRDPYSGKYYAFWTYDNKNDYGNKQYPRLRIALAESSDNQKTWNYIMDVDEFEYNTTNFNRFQNLSIDFTEDAIYLNFIRNAPTASSSNAITSRVVRVERDKIKTLGRFPYLHIRGKTKVPYAITDVVSKSLYTLKGTNVAVINGYKYSFNDVVYVENEECVLTDALEVYLGYELGGDTYTKICDVSKNIIVSGDDLIMSEYLGIEDKDGLLEYLRSAY